MSAAVDNVAVAAAAGPVVEDKTADAPAVADNVATNAAAVADNNAITPAPAAEEAPKPAVIDITSKAQFDALRKETPYVALQAHATWCGPCKLISPLFKNHAEKQAELRESYAFARFDIDDIPDLAEELEIRSVPSFFFFDSSSEVAPKPVADLTGAKPQPLIGLIDTYAAKAKEAKFSTTEDF